MNGMYRIFLMVCNMSVTAGFVIVLVLAARLLLRRAPRSFSYCLWILVAFRLVCPYSFSSAASIFSLDVFRGYMTGNQAIWTGQEGMSELPFNSESGTADGDEAFESQDIYKADRARGTKNVPGEESPKNRSGTADNAGAESAAGIREEAGVSGGLDAEGGTVLREGAADFERRGIKVLTGLWLLGIVAFLGYQFYVYHRLRNSVATAIPYEKGIYECESIAVPFVMGFIKPGIYLPLGITESEREHILLHEQNHIRRHDYQVKFLALLLLSVYWFHPLVWLAYFLMCEDMEMSCDEKVIGGMSGSEKKDYCRTLLHLASRDGARIRLASGQPSFGDSSIKHRIKNILDFKNPEKQAVILGAALCILVVFIGLANGQHKLQIRCVKPPGTGEIEYEYRLDRKIQSILIYKEYYLQGEMLSYEIVRSDDLAETDADKRGRIIIDAKRNLEDGGVAFLSRLEGEDTFAENSTTWQMLGFYGYQGMSENYYLSNQTGWQEIGAEQELTLAAWHLQGSKQDILEALSCQDFMDAETKQQALKKNAGEILYYMVFSEKDAEELEAEYAVSPYARSLYEAKNPYIGDAPADERLIESIGVFPDMKRTMELMTEEEPYVLKIHFEEPPQNEVSFHEEMEKKAILLLCLIDNASQVEWTYPIENGEGQRERRFYCGREQAAGRLGLDKIEDMERFAESADGVQNLLTEYIPYIYPEISANNIGLGVEGAYMSPEGQFYQYIAYVVGRLPGERYDQVFQVLADEEDVTIEDVEKALSEGGVSEKIYVLR